MTRNGDRDFLIQMMTMNRISAIKSLFSKGNPSAVFWTVISIYINSLNRKVILIVRIFNPIRKINIIIPFFTNFYTSATVIFVSKIVRVLTSLAHTLPNFVDSGKRFVMLCKRFSTPTRPTVMGLITLIRSAFENLLASQTSKFKISSIFIAVHSPIIQRLG